MYEERSGVMETIRENPIPAAIAGIGLGWLWINRRSVPPHRRAQSGNRAGIYDTPSVEARQYGSPSPYRGYGSAEAYDERRHEGHGSVDQGKQAVRDTVSRAQAATGNAANQAQETIGNAAGRAQAAVGQLAGRAHDRAGDLAARAQGQAQRVEDHVQSALHETPLTLGALAMAVGAAVGLATPGTRREDELMGEARDSLFDHAQERASEAADKVKRVAGQVADEAGSAASQAAREHGLAPKGS